MKSSQLHRRSGLQFMLWFTALSLLVLPFAVFQRPSPLMEVFVGQCGYFVALPIFVAISTIKNDSLTAYRHAKMVAGKKNFCISFEHAFIGHDDQNSSNPPVLAIPSDFPHHAPHWWDNKSVDLSRKLMFLLQYVTGRGDIKWLFRVTADTEWNFGELARWAWALPDADEQHLFGDCVTRGEWEPYPQGGSGYVISREAARVLATNPDGYWARMARAQAEDVGLGIIVAELLHRSGGDLTSPFMVGHWGGIGQPRQLLLDRNWEALPPCQQVDEIWPGKCRRFLMPLSRTIVYHEKGSADLLTIEALAAASFAAPSYVKWYQDGEEPRVCKDVDSELKLEPLPLVRKSG